MNASTVAAHPSVEPPPDRAARRIAHITRAFLILFLVGAVYRGYWIYSQADHSGATSAYLNFVHGTGPAPFQYRAAPVLIANVFYQHLHWPFRYGFTLEDLVASFAAVLGGYELLRARPLFRHASAALQALASAAYAALALYLFAWQDFYKKDETDAAALLAMLVLAAWSARPGRIASTAVRSVLVLLAIIALSCIRADIALCLSVGMFAVAFLGRGELAVPRVPALAVAALSGVAALATQATLMKIVFPHAGPYESAVFMLPQDIRNPAHVAVFLVYAAPSLWALVRALRLRYTGDDAALGCAFGAVPFLLLWALFGRLEEVRIFLPVGLTVAVLAAQIVLVDLAGISTQKKVK